jgi:hydrogenase maturation protein HypF
MVYQQAMAMHLHGYVQNSSDGVHIFFNADEDTAVGFLKKIKENVPSRAVIRSAILHVAESRAFNDFTIITEGTGTHRKQVLTPPDVAMCAECRRELHDTANNRYRYPFITCTQCGPRYSIIERLPYERHTTAMLSFAMCENCNKEYNSVADLRFFSQTNSCAVCGIRLSMYDNNSSVLSTDTEKVLSAIKELLQQGKILAVKGTGGYLLLCDANNAAAIQQLRIRKHRPAKPFAILCPGIENVLACFEVSNPEKALLQSQEAPIALLYPRPSAQAGLAINDIAPRLNRVGVMLPCNPLLELVATDFGKPLVATSANVSGSPIIYKDEDALAHLSGIADYIVACNRDIVIPQDDSVVQVTKYTGQKIILRRSRGYAPSYLSYKPGCNATMLASGAFMKNSFTLAAEGNVFISQFLGSCESYESREMYIHTLQHWLKLYEITPDVVIADMHPGYFSNKYAATLARHYNVPIQLVQHHEAHFAAVLAENDLINTQWPVLGIIWDGTGLGTDGNIWGGEFFVYRNKEMLRYSHFDYFPAIAGDQLALQPRIAALCAAYNVTGLAPVLKKKFTSAEWNNYHALINNSNLATSSAGRIFDAVASLLGVCDRQSYEGEAAMYLQVMAEAYVHKHGFVMDAAYFPEQEGFAAISVTRLMQGIAGDLAARKPVDYIAAKFHYSLARLAGAIAHNAGVKDICFSGGVFQNALLTDWLQHELGDKYTLHFHEALSPNDENISFGQMVYHDNGLRTATTDERAEHKPVTETNKILAL